MAVILRYHSQEDLGWFIGSGNRQVDSQLVRQTCSAAVQLSEDVSRLVGGYNVVLTGYIILRTSSRRK